MEEAVHFFRGTPRLFCSVSECIQLIFDCQLNLNFLFFLIYLFIYLFVVVVVKPEHYF